MTKERLEATIFRSKVNIVLYALITLGGAFLYMNTGSNLFIYGSIVSFAIGLFSIWSKNFLQRLLDEGKYE